ncbi:immunoglobulin domain-containing protein Bsg isoform X2 [Arctopsyche grandis]|uniref:immunoglobulin domain-containing protein Bsg isoform X2 n=1 Tax=Arctopsyche grandis TaxID=121162 RepID=UPI00406D7D47
MQSLLTAALRTPLLGALLLLLTQHIARAENSIKPNYDHDQYKIFDIRTPLVLSCNVTMEGKYELEWLKDDSPVSEDKGLRDRYRIIADENKFVIERTVEGDAGIYTCKAGDLQATIDAVAKPTVRLPPNTSVVEGEKLRIHCVAAGKPTPSVEWAIGNETYNESRGRVILEDDNGVKNAIFTLTDITLDDRGDYYCRASNVASNYVNHTQDSTFVRVKDNLAALWPFLGICAEVFVLCAIILVYENRRNKPELEESDTDQSPDQKKG